MADKKTSAKKTSDKKDAKKDDKKAKKNAWLNYSEKTKKDVLAFNEEYKQFISKCKTERECVDETVALIEKAGYKNLNECIKAGKKLKAGDKVYYNNMGKALAMFIIGKQPMENGMKILGAHIDSPRMDLKQVPVYEDTEMCYLDTHYYGGIKKYQWVTLPLALHGVVCKKDGSTIKVNIGEDPQDPVFQITDLLIHLAGDQMGKTAGKVIEGEALDLLVGSMPLKDEDKDAVKANVLALIKEKYDFEEEDFLSAEIEVVPAGAARDLGFDRSMVTGYGHDDRVCAYTSLAAMLEMKEVDRTAACLIVDKEEIGSVGATGMSSVFFENAVAELINLTTDYSELKVRRCLANSHMLSSDVSAAYDPSYAGVFERKNTAFFGRGIVFNKFTGSRGKSGSNDANPEFIAQIRSAMEKHKVPFQTAELGKVDVGGGGTIAYIMAKYNMQVIDAGVPVLCMHAPWEIVSKSDVWEAKQAYVAFLKEI